MEHERRQHPRVRPQPALELETDRRVRLEVVDVSPGGLQVRSGRPLRPGAPLRLVVPGSGTRLEATVRRCRAVTEPGGGLTYVSGLELERSEPDILDLL
ncbi:MAG: PilZ domain-containing protein, partial [Nitrospirae bacterium]